MKDDKGAPVADATVTVNSASQHTSSPTDSTGHYVFLSLIPDTYTVSAEKSGYSPVSVAGVTVFAGNTFSLDLTLPPATIGKTTSTAQGLVRTGQTTDVYSVDAATAEKVSTLGGGANLNQAYSALASQPGVFLGYGGIGWGQTIYIHGASYSQVGYEYDGVPVNRAFDNYNANTLTNLGQSELQVVSGGSPASSSSSTVGGYINQVIKTGTFPGFGLVNLGVSAPDYYHAVRAEAGGASPNRLFSYYVGLLGYDQTQRFQDQFNGGTSVPGIFPVTTTFNSCCPFTGGSYPFCDASGNAPPLPAAMAGLTDNPGCLGGPFSFALGATTLEQDREAVANFHFGIPHKRDGGKDDIQLLYSGSFQHQANGDSVNDYGGGSFYTNQLSAGFINPTATQWADALIFAPGAASFGQTVAPGGTVPLQPYFFPNSPTNRAISNNQCILFNVGLSGTNCLTGSTGVPTATIPAGQRAGQGNDSEILKAQYTHNMGSNAYLRLYGYTFYSDWLLNDPTAAELVYKIGSGITFPLAGNYELITHTKGGQLQYANQINSKHLLQADLSYTTAQVSRFNNGTFRNRDDGGSAATNLIGTGANSLNCYNSGTGAIANCFSGVSQGSFFNPAPTAIPASCVAAGCHWAVTFLGPRGTLNNVVPKFSAFSISDEFRPNDKWLFNIGLRGDRFEYDLNPTNGADYKFWFNAVANSACYDPANSNQALLVPNPPPTFIGSAALFTTTPGTLCPNSPITSTPMLHPNGSNAAGSGNPAGSTPLLFSPATNNTYSVSKLEPRFSGTYTQSPDTVWRFSAGSYVNPFNTATVEYLDASAQRAAIFDFQTFFGIGFTTPEHDVQPTTSNNYDLSLERHIRGTDTTFKISPFFRVVKNQTQDSFIGPGFVSAIPTGDERAWGLEAQIQKGDPNQEGWSGQLSYTYTKAYTTFNPIGTSGLNLIDGINGAVAQYNALTLAGSGTTYKQSNGNTITLGTAFPCYHSGVGIPAGPNCIVSGSTITFGGTCQPVGIAECVQNPYYFMPAQPYYDTAGKYPLYQTFPNQNEAFPDFNGTILWPNQFAGYLNFKHKKLSITPNFQLYEGFNGGSNGGGQYGSPLSILGVDPRTCFDNQAGVGVTTGSTAQFPAYTSCSGASASGGGFYIPNPYTGKFDNFGQYQNPWLLNVNAQIKYEVSPRVTASLLLANIFNKCFGGSSTPWSSANPPGSTVCGYASSGAFAGGLTQQPGSGYFFGTSPTDPNNWPTSQVAGGNIGYYPYSGTTSFFPFNAFLNFQIKF